MRPKFFSAIGIFYIGSAGLDLSDCNIIHCSARGLCSQELIIESTNVELRFKERVRETKLMDFFFDLLFCQVF